MGLERDDWRHGTVGGYTNCLCRCDRCTAAQAKQQADWRSRQQALAPGDPRHGSINGYTNYRCRCGPCVEARRVTARAYQARRRARGATR